MLLHLYLRCCFSGSISGYEEQRWDAWKRRVVDDGVASITLRSSTESKTLSITDEAAILELEEIFAHMTPLQHRQFSNEVSFDLDVITAGGELWEGSFRLNDEAYPEAVVVHFYYGFTGRATFYSNQLYDWLGIYGFE